MSWYVRISRFLSVHMIYAQHAQNSCGMASIMMVNFKLKKGVLAAGIGAGAALSNVPVVGSAAGQAVIKAAMDYAVKSEPQVYAEYTKVTGSPYDGSQYSDAMKFPAVLKNLGLGEWECVNVGEAGFADASKAATEKGAPVIGHVVWDGGGAHFVVIDEHHVGYGCVNDPWDGDLHVTRMGSATPVIYNAGDTIFSFSFGGTRHNYPAGDKGKFSGWIVRKK